MGSPKEGRQDLKFIENWLRNEAKERGISIEALMEQIEKNSALMNQDLPEGNRLQVAEGYVQAGELSPEQVDMMIRKNPILPDEMRQISGEIEETLGLAYGFEFHDYILEPDSKLTEKIPGFWSLVNHVDKRIKIPTQMSIWALLGLVHEKAHTLQFEQSKLYRVIKELDVKGDEEAVKRHFQNSECLIEGWAEFVALRYAELRDKAIGVSMYKKKQQEIVQIKHFWDSVTHRQAWRPYYEGARLFEKIYKHDGFMSAYWAAMNLTTDQELYAYAQEEIPTGERTPLVYV